MILFRLLPFVTLMSVMLALAWPAEAQTFGDIRISADTPPDGGTTGGYVEYRFIIVNRSTDTDHRVALVMPASTWGGQGHRVREIRRATLVPAGSTVELPLLQPPMPMHGDGVRVIIDGQTQRDRLSLYMPSHGHQREYWHHRSNPSLAVLASPSIAGGLRDRLEAAVSWTGPGSSSMYGESVRQLHRASDPPRQWSTNWLAYSAYAGVVLRDSELTAMPSAARDALWAYVTAGGTLLVLGEDAAVPEPWTQRHQAAFGKEHAAGYYVGYGECWALPEEALSAAIDDAQVERARASSGTSSSPHHPPVTSPAPAPGADDAAIQHLSQFWLRSGNVLNRQETLQNANSRFPIVDHLGVPVRGLLALMLIFGVAIGPVNLVVVSKLNRRIWMLWTVPVIALLFASAVFGYATVAEGWRADARLAGLTLLDEGSRRATTLGAAAYYSPLTPRDGLRFSYHTEVTPQIRIDTWSNEGSSRFVDWTQDQHLSTGWVTARVPAHFALRKSETRRERLTIGHTATGELTATNALGADIEQVFVADDQRRLFTARQVPAGATVPLTALSQHHGSPQEDALRTIFTRDWVRTIDQLAATESRASRTEAARLLQPNSYLAVVDGAPFLEPGLAHARQRRSQSVVFGLLAEGFSHGN